MPTTIPFSLLTAFSSVHHGGNPAAVTFMDLDLPTNVFEIVARNFNQPMTTFVSPLPLPLPLKDKSAIAFGIRWFSPTAIEIPLCGHGTLAAAKAVFERSDLAAEHVTVIEFHSLTCGVMTARKLDGGFIEIRLPSAVPDKVSLDESAKLSAVLFAAFGREVAINYIGKGGKGFEHYMMVELDEKENLQDCYVNAEALRNSGYQIHVITTASSAENQLFVSRMFAPAIISSGEDHVCGTAHCLIAPYWYKKRDIPRGQEIKARQVSPRGGDLKLIWESNQDVVRLMGELTVLAKGELLL